MSEHPTHLPSTARAYARPRPLGFALGIALGFMGFASVADAGTLTLEVGDPGPEPGTVWILVSLDPVDWGPCQECLLPDRSEVHVVPAPVHGSGGSYPRGQFLVLDETGGTVRGDGYVREILVDLAQSYTINAASTTRSGFVTGIDGSCTGDLVACTYTVTDYPEADIGVGAVATEPTSFTTIKSEYRE